MAEKNLPAKDESLEKILAEAIKIPGVKVNRKQFLAEQFAKEQCDLQAVMDQGPVAAGCSREMLKKKASALVLNRTSRSSAVSFAAGLPGGLVMAVSIPADVLQFFGMTLRLAQELVYLYGGKDLWENGEVDSDAVRNELVMYCGVMFGVSGAAAGVRLLSSQIAKTTLKKLPQKALTKTVWFPIVKQIGKAIGVKVTKSTVAKGISKAIPVIGGVISGGLNFASMMPMGNRLAQTLDDASFDYTEEEILNDYKEISDIAAKGEVLNPDESPDAGKKADPIQNITSGVTGGLQQIGSGIAGLFGRKKPDEPETKDKKNEKEGTAPAEEKQEGNDSYDALIKLAKLKEMGIISEEEFEQKKKELLSKF